MGQPTKRDEVPLMPISPCLPFEILEIDFVEPFPKQGKGTRERYDIKTFEYLTKWAELEPIGNCTK